MEWILITVVVIALALFAAAAVRYARHSGTASSNEQYTDALKKHGGGGGFTAI